MAKLDIVHAYHNIPVHPDDRHLLGMMWNNQLFIDTVLPFGLRSTPKIFSAVADTLKWILTQQGVSHSIHHLDDLFIVGSPTYNECNKNLHQITETCKLLGVPLPPEKIVGPTRQLTFLGIKIDSESLRVRLPQEKLKLLITSWRNRKAAKKRQLLSLISHLAHAYKVVPPGRTFLRCIINLSYPFQKTWTTGFARMLSCSRMCSGGISSWRSGMAFHAYTHISHPKMR